MSEIFPFDELPLVVQDLITEKIVHELHPKERLKFKLTSKTCNWLVGRAKPPLKIYNNLDIFSNLGNCYIVYGYRKISGLNDIVLKLLSNIQIADNFKLKIDDTPLNLEVISIIGKSIKFANHILIEGEKENLSIIKLIQCIHDYQEFKCRMPLPVTELLTSLPNHKNITLEDVDVNDDSLVVLAELTNERNPIKFLNITSSSTFSVAGILDFIKVGDFSFLSLKLDNIFFIYEIVFFQTLMIIHWNQK